MNELIEMSQNHLFSPIKFPKITVKHDRHVTMSFLEVVFMPRIRFSRLQVDLTSIFQLLDHFLTKLNFENFRSVGSIVVADDQKEVHFIEILTFG